MNKMKESNMSTEIEKKVEFIQVVLSNVRIEIECLHRNTFRLFRDYLSNFKTPDFVVSVTENEISAERKVYSHLISGSTICIITDSDLSIESAVLHRKIANAMVAYSTFLIHGAVVATAGNAYMLTAPSGTGKSTRTKLWLEEYSDSIIVNDDKPFIKISDDTVLACGTPWCGKEGWNTNTMVPLRAIFLLERAEEGEENSIEEVSLGKAFPFLLQQTYRPSDPDLMRKTIQLLKALEGKVKFYKFRSAPTPEAVRLAYETARPK